MDHDWMRLAREAYTASTTYFDASIRPGIEQDLRQFQGQHPTGSKYLHESYRSRAKVFRPKTRSTIRKNEAIAAEALFSTNDVVAVSAQDDSDPVKQASAEVMQELLQFRLTKTIPWFLTAIGAYQDTQATGVVVSYQYWDFDAAKGTDKPCIDLIPVENIRIDPGANWADPINTSPYVIHMLPMYVKDVQAKARSEKWKSVPEERLLKAVREQSDSIRLTREQGRQDSKDQTTGITAYSIVWVHRNIIEMDGQDWVYYTLGTYEILSEPKPINEVYFHGARPYVMGICALETHKTYPGGVSRLTKDVQAEINEITNQRLDNVKFALNKRYFVKRNKQVDLRSLTRNVPGSVTMLTDPDQDVKVLETNDVTGSAYQEQDRLNLDFDDVAGAFSSASVQSNRRLNETVGGMNILTTNANQVTGYQLRTFVETWVEPVLRQLVLLEQYYETDETVLALAGQKAQLAQKFGIDKVTDEMLMQEFALSVNVGMSATNPAQQVEAFIGGMRMLKEILADGILERYGLKVDEVIKELFGKLGYKGGGRFFDQSEDPRIISAQKTIEQMQKALESKVDPAMLQKQIEKIDAEIKKITADSVKTGVESAFAAMQAGQVVATTPMVAPVADEIMRGAGYQDQHGVDPNFPQPSIGPQPFAQEAMPGDTSPMTPGSPAEGAMHGINTQEFGA